MTQSKSLGCVFVGVHAHAVVNGMWGHGRVGAVCWRRPGVLIPQLLLIQPPSALIAHLQVMERGKALLQEDVHLLHFKNEAEQKSHGKSVWEEPSPAPSCKEIKVLLKGGTESFAGHSHF